jgi:cell division protein FtsI/penicillin-binding protein 2
MSPLHAAMIAATVANHGRMMRPQIVDRIVDASGKLVSRAEPELHRSVLERRTADLLARMMRTTVAQGTARKTFFDAKGNPFLPGIEVAGKTGTLSKERPYRGYTWFVGFAPAKAPKVAVAALIVNSPKWRIKAAYLAREALRYYLIEAPKKITAQVASR